MYFRCAGRYSGDAAGEVRPGPTGKERVKILVCVKQVPAAESPLKLDGKREWVEVGESAEFGMNRYDEFAVEEAVLLKEAHPGTRIDIVSLGPPRAASTIKRALGMGADHGIHLVTGEEGYLSPLVTASRIAAVAADGGYHLILAGVMSEDAMQGQVGPMLAELLGVPCATSVVEIEVRGTGPAVSVRREVEGGCREHLELRMPVLLTVQSGINKPRYPSFSNIMRTKNMPLRTLEADGLGPQRAPERVVAVSHPPRMRNAETPTGTGQEKAAKLLEILGRKVSLREEGL